MSKAASTLIAVVEVPRAGSTLRLEFWAGTSILLLGANGTGKTRLGVLIENALGEQALRISAHRSLTMNTNVPIKSLATALHQLRYGSEHANRQPQAHERVNYRWGNAPATRLLSDFDHLIVALYAEQADVAVRYLNDEPGAARPKTRLSRLVELWRHLLPHRKLLIEHGSLSVEGDSHGYSAGELSDGERVLFYLLAHALLAPSGSVVIVDEPELHVNRAILQSLWDAIESERQDCCFVYVTHDLEMAASRRGALRFVVEQYRFPGLWEIEPIPSDIDLPEDLVAKIVGSRAPILFVEGIAGSLDSMIYRHVYTRFTVHSAGTCDDVIRTVQSFNRHGVLHRIGCAGLVDADDRDSVALAFLRERNIHVLPVAEIENFMLLPGPFIELAKVALHLDETAAQQLLAQVKDRVFAKAQANLDATAIEAARRTVDALMKRIELAKDTPKAMQDSYQNAVGAIDPMAIYGRRRAEIEGAIQGRDYEKVLLLYANKGLFAEAASILGIRRDALERLLGRLLGANEGGSLLAAVRRALPDEAELLRALHPASQS
jgi:hypothetical protein